MFFEVTLNQGRTDTVIVEMDSVLNVKTFFQTVSTANITMIKKIVFSKKLGIGSSNTTYTSNNQDKYIDILVRTKKGGCKTVNLPFPIKQISNKDISKYIKKYLLINDDTIEEVLNIILCK